MSSMNSNNNKNSTNDVGTGAEECFRKPSIVTSDMFLQSQMHVSPDTLGLSVDMSSYFARQPSILRQLHTQQLQHEQQESAGFTGDREENQLPPLRRSSFPQPAVKLPGFSALRAYVPAFNGSSLDPIMYGAQGGFEYIKPTNLHPGLVEVNPANNHQVTVNLDSSSDDLSSSSALCSHHNDCCSSSHQSEHKVFSSSSDDVTSRASSQSVSSSSIDASSESSDPPTFISRPNQYQRRPYARSPIQIMDQRELVNEIYRNQQLHSLTNLKRSRDDQVQFATDDFADGSDVHGNGKRGKFSRDLGYGMPPTPRSLPSSSPPHRTIPVPSRSQSLQSEGQRKRSAIVCPQCGEPYSRVDALRRHLNQASKYGGICRAKRGRISQTERQLLQVHNSHRFK